MHTGSENHCETTKSLKSCYLFNTNQEGVYRIKVSDVDKLKWHINSEWTGLSHVVIEYAISEFHQHLRACVRAEGGHFEHTV